MLPIVIRSTESMLRLVPDDLREGSAALGASKSRMILTVVLPGRPARHHQRQPAGGGPGRGRDGAAAVHHRRRPQPQPRPLRRRPTPPCRRRSSSTPGQPFLGAQDRAWGAALTLIVLVLRAHDRRPDHRQAVHPALDAPRCAGVPVWGTLRGNDWGPRPTTGLRHRVLLVLGRLTVAVDRSADSGSRRRSRLQPQPGGPATEARAGRGWGGPGRPASPVRPQPLDLQAAGYELPPGGSVYAARVVEGGDRPLYVDYVAGRGAGRRLLAGLVDQGAGRPGRARLAASLGFTGGGRRHVRRGLPGRPPCGRSTGPPSSTATTSTTTSSSASPASTGSTPTS